MSAERLDVFVTNERGEKTYWTKVGSAFVNREQVVEDARLPVQLARALLRIEHLGAHDVANAVGQVVREGVACERHRQA